MALFLREEFIPLLPANAGIVDIGDFWITVVSDDLALGEKLYAAGALIVLPAGLLGCLPLP